MILTFDERLIVVAVFLTYGLVGVFRPQWIARFQVWTNQKILGAKFEPSEKTLKIYRGFGFMFATLGIIVFLLG